MLTQLLQQFGLRGLWVWSSNGQPQPSKQAGPGRGQFQYICFALSCGSNEDIGYQKWILCFGQFQLLGAPTGGPLGQETHVCLGPRGPDGQNYALHGSWAQFQSNRPAACFGSMDTADKTDHLEWLGHPLDRDSIILWSDPPPEPLLVLTGMTGA